MSQERRKNNRIKVTSNSLAFISDNVTGYAAAFSAAILDINEKGVGFVYISDQQHNDTEFTMELIDKTMHIEDIPIIMKYNVSFDSYEQFGKKCGASFQQLTDDQKNDIQTFIQRQNFHENE
jgi:hypothetical protein